MSHAPSAQPKTLAEDLRGRSDDQLAALLRARPDLLHPVPSDMRALTTRAATSPSIARYLDTVDCIHHFALRIASELTTDEPTSAEQILAAIIEAVGVDSIRADAHRAIENLHAAAVLWGTPERIHVVTSVRDQVATAPVPQWPAPTCQGPIIDAALRASASAHGGAAAQGLIGTIAEIADRWSREPGPVLRSGGLSARALDALADILDTPREQVMTALDLAWSAGLIAQGSTGSDIGWMPTEAFENWSNEPAAKRWAKIARVWQQRPATTSTRALLGNDHAFVRVWRSHLLTALLDAPQGCDLKTVIEVVDFRWPRRRGSKRTDALTASWLEAEHLGIVVDGVLTDAGVALATDATTATVASTIAQHFASEVDTVHIQGDHTIVAPGPLRPEVGRRLRAIADVESRGHATVLRLTNASLRRGLSMDPEISSWQQFFEEISRAPVPQPVAYLLADAARQAPPARSSHRAPAEPTPVRRTHIEASSARVEKALDVLRAREERSVPDIVAELEGSDVPAMEGAAVVAALRYSIDHHETVRISHAQSDGSTGLLLVDPIRLGGGSLTAYDHHDEQVRTFAISRIGGVSTVRISA